MTIILFDGTTDEVVHVQAFDGMKPPEYYFGIVCAHRGLVADDHYFQTVNGGYTTNMFYTLYYIDASGVHLKEPIEPEVSSYEIVAGISTCHISNIPENTSLFLDQVFSGTVGADGLVDISSSVPKKIKVELVNEPAYRVKEFEINVIDS